MESKFALGDIVYTFSKGKIFQTKITVMEEDKDALGNSFILYTLEDILGEESIVLTDKDFSEDKQGLLNIIENYRSKIIASNF